MDGGEAFRSLRERVMGQRGVIMVIGGHDTGKTTLAKLLVRDALGRGHTVGFVDGDVGVPSVGPPACVSLKLIASMVSLERIREPDEIRFVGSTTPAGVVLPHVVATGALVDIARESSDVVIVDTTSVVAGVVGETLKYYLAEVCAPDLVIALERGSEMEPIIAMLRRFQAARVAVATADVDELPPSPVERRESLRAAFAEELREPQQRWRVHSGVFAPTLPEGFEPERLQGIVVGVQDGTGRCLGLGVLEHSAGILSVATSHGEEMEGLRLASLRIDVSTFETERVRLRELIFGI